MDNPRVVGIDLGTTNSLAAVVRDGRPEVFRDASGVALVPSALCLAADGSVLVGSAAKAQALLDPEHTVLSVKRMMGRTLNELAAELPLIPQQLVERDAGGGRKVLRVVVGDRELTPEELSALILKEVRGRAGNPTKAVVTVPAYFDDAQRQATRDAGRIAGLDVLRIVNEPTAAALAYGLDKRDAGTVAVYDLGGGTFDCSVLKLSGGVFRVLSTNGDTRLGGDDFDRALYTHAAADWGLDLSVRDPELVQHLRAAAERCKHALSESESAELRVTLPARGLDRARTVTRAEFESLIAPLVERSLARCRAALRDAELTPADVDEVVLVGGSTRVPLVRRRVGEFFGRAPHADLNPDEVVALGAAIQADILAGGSRDTLLLDVVPLSLGIETLGGVVDKLVHRNQAVPCSATSRYTTFKDGQTAIKLTIYQGERELTKDCRRLGEFTLAGIPPMVAQLAQVDVTFLVDANGQLGVTAVEQRSGARAEVRVQAASGLSPDEVEKLVLESVEHAHGDFTARQLIELRNKAAGDLRAARSGLAAQGEHLAPKSRADVEAAVAELERAAAGSDLPALQRAGARFNEVTDALAELVMSAAATKMLGGRREDEMRP